MTALLWLRRDLRRGDLPALGAAARDGEVLPLFVVDPGLWIGGGAVRRAWLAANVLAARERYDGKVSVLAGRPEEIVPALASAVGATAVHVSRETTPAGRRRDLRVEAALAAREIAWVETGTPYAVGPGLVTKDNGDPYAVFTPFSKAWRAYGCPDPATEPSPVRLIGAGGELRPAASPGGQLDLPPRLDAAAREGEAMLAAALAAPGLPELPPAGEAAALARWREFRETGLAAYDEERDRPDRDGTSFMSPYLKVGAIHPRTMLADLRDGSAGATRLITELAWREFYADVLWHHPDSAWQDLRDTLAGMSYEAPEDAIEAWRQGRTGYPIVDAGMRQLLTTGWMHNRVRMITASFLTKDLHVWWPVGARHFLDHLLDGDLASNSHGWQWVAGTGTDAAPYFRVFNPITQGLKFDPNGDYVRRFVPELAHLPGAAAHEPWRHPGGYGGNYPRRIVDHADERTEALRRYEAARR